MANVRFALSVATVFALAACSGQQANTMPSAASNVTPVQQAAMQPDACRNEGGVRVTPCRVDFTASNPGPVTITLRTPHGSKGSVVEHDNCTDIATVTQQPDGSWQVAAGSVAGSCHARFNYFNNGNLVGFAVVQIKNEI